MDAASPAVAADLTPTRVPWIAVAVYAALACALAWVVTLPMWLSGEGLAHPFALPLMGLMMTTPSVAALAVTFWIVRPPKVARSLGLIPFRPAWRSIIVMLVWPVLWLALGFGAVVVASAFGWVETDWGMSSLQATLPAELPVEVAFAITLAVLPVNVLISSIPAFGEELGWRGFLTTALAPLGFWRTALISGVLWGVWHAPIILLGYNFFRPDALGVALMCGFTLFVGVLLQISRVWCRNVWVAAVGHGALNATVPLSLLVITDSADPAIGTVLGVPGWMLMAVVIAILVTVGLTGRRLPKPLVPGPGSRPERSSAVEAAEESAIDQP